MHPLSLPKGIRGKNLQLGDEYEFNGEGHKPELWGKSERGNYFLNSPDRNSGFKKKPDTRRETYWETLAKVAD